MTDQPNPKDVARKEHPFTAMLTRNDGHGDFLPKVEVRLSDGSRRCLRPRWVGVFHGQEVNAWCVQRWGCPQVLAESGEGWPKWKTL